MKTSDNGQPTCEVVTSLSRLSELARAWDDLVDVSRRPQRTRRPAWNLAWWRVFGGLEGRELRCLCVFEGGDLVGLAPLLARPIRSLVDARNDASGDRFGVGLPVSLRRLELIGSGEPRDDEICSEYLGVVARRDREDVVADAMAAVLRSEPGPLDFTLDRLPSSPSIERARRELGNYDELVLTALDGDDPTVSRLHAALSGTDDRCSLEVIREAPYIELPSSWDDYLHAKSSSRRYRIRRTLRRFEDWSKGDYQLCRAETPEQLVQGMKILTDLHRERWLDDGGLGVFASARFVRFHARIMPTLLDEGALDLTWLLVAGRPVAAQYSYLSGDAIHFYQSGRAVSVPKRVAIGNVLHLMNIQRAIEAGHREYDFLAGTSRYKKELATHCRSLMRLRLLRSTAVGQLYRVGWQAVDWLRSARDAYVQGLPRSRSRSREAGYAAPTR